MPSIKLTQSNLETLQSNPSKPVFYWDKTLPGFGVKVSPSGRRSYIVQAQMQVGVSKRRVKLNDCERMTLRAAKEVARKQLASMGLGVDPIRERRSVEMANMTLRKALEDRIEMKGLKPKVASDYRSIAANAFPDWLDRPMATITDQMAVDRHRAVTAKRGAHTANYAMRVLSSAFGHARGHFGLKAANPVARLREGKLFNRVRPRDEYVEPHELPVLLRVLRRMEVARQSIDVAQQEAARAAGLSWAAWRGKTQTKRLQGPALAYSGAADIVRVLLLTGFRLEEAQGLEWSNVDLERKTITLTNNKASRMLKMPMAPALASLLGRRMQSQENGEGGLSKWVFPTTGGGRYQNLGSRDMPAISKAASAELGGHFHLHAHKIRHTFATYLRAMGHSEWTVAALLNHSRNSVTSIYAAPIAGSMHRIVDEYQGWILELLGLCQEEAIELLSGTEAPRPRL